MEERKKNYRFLLKYIDYFESAFIHQTNNPSQKNPFIKDYLPHYQIYDDGLDKFINDGSQYPIYEDELNTFIEDVYHSEILMKNYIGHLEDKFSGKQWTYDDIETAGFTTLRAMLTKCVREERFYDDSW